MTTGNGYLGYAMLEVVLSLMIFAAVAVGYVTLYRQLQLHAADMMQRTHAQNLVDNMTAQLLLDRTSSA
jgi:Tfp pilus assembly protein PilV